MIASKPKTHRTLSIYFIFISISFKNYLYMVKVTKGLDLQTCPVFTLLTLIFTRKKANYHKNEKKTE